jgi:hypothetical protein
MVAARIAAPLAERLAAVPAETWARWLGHAATPAAARPLVVAVAALPVPDVEAALVLVASEHAGGLHGYRQVVVATGDAGEAPVDGVPSAGNEGVVPGLGHPHVRRWLHEALTAGIGLRAGGWEWRAAPEVRGASVLVDDAGTLERRGDGEVVRASASTLAFPVRTDPDAGIELELLRRLAGGDGAHLAPRPLAAARWVGPDGVRLPSLLVHDLPAAARPIAERLAGRIVAGLGGDAVAFEAAVADAHALGRVARELHAALGRPPAEGFGGAAIPAGRRDVEAWALEARDALDALEREAQGAAHDAQPAIVALRDHLHAVVAAAGRDPGLVHRIHGALDADAVHLLPDGTLRVTGFAPPPTIGSPSPWHDVAALLASLTRLAGEAAMVAGDDDGARDAAWRWEREARRAALDGYGTGGGAGHALAALFEIPLVARRMRAALRDDPAHAWIGAHAVARLAHVAT